MSVNAETLDKIKNQLKEGRDVGNNIPQDLYSHLTEVFNRILLHHPLDAYDKFEEISALVKKTHLKFQDPQFDFEVNAEHAPAAKSAKDIWIQKSKNLLNEINDLVRTEDRKLLAQKKAFTMPNIAEEAEMLEWAGISFGEEETYKLQKSLKRLAIMSGADSIRFAGKIYGSNKDYWVACGELKTAEEKSKDPAVEKRGEGVNAVVYWVTDNLLNDWIQLPDVKPEHVVVARMIKHVFTGDLNACIDSNPPFPGRERHLLRAQLARIFHATALTPKGMLEIDDETNEIKFAEDFGFPAVDDLKSLETWGNVYPLILKAGRTKHYVPPEIGEDDQEEYLAKLEEDDKSVEETFRAVQEHNPMPGMETAWLSKVYGDQQQYRKGEEATTAYCVNVLKSLRWPGALTVAKGGKFTSIYVGYGMKRGDPSYNPIEPPEVQKDPIDQVEMPEPTPLEAPQEPPEPDTDKKAGDSEEEDD